MNFRSKIAPFRKAGPPALGILFLCFGQLLGADDRALMRSAAGDGKVSNPEKRLFEESIRSTKQSIAKETLDVFYRDAVDYYRQKRYDDALEQLDQIYQVDPSYEDVAQLRETVRRAKNNREEATRGLSVREYMKKGNDAITSGERVAAIHYWEQALEVDPNYTIARRKIREVKHMLAQHQFESGYIHFHHGDLEDALDAWSNAIALDPTYKQRGLLLLMSKVELGIKRDKAAKLAAQGYEQYTQKNLLEALNSYNEVLKTSPRHEEARRMTAKIKIQLGQEAFKSAQQLAGEKQYAEAIEAYKRSIKYEWEVPLSQKAIQDAEAAIALANRPPPVVKAPPPPAASSSSSAAPPPPPVVRGDPAEAMAHYRAGLGAIRQKDFHRALDELEAATKIDPTNEQFYVARERARQLNQAAQ